LEPRVILLETGILNCTPFRPDTGLSRRA